MELTAVIQGLFAIKEACHVRIETDSEYVHKGITEWMERWRQNGWQTSGKKPVKNQDLWKALDEALARHRVSWQWVKAHATHPDNIHVDRLANDAARLEARNVR